MEHQEVKGDLISLALQGTFDIIVHGCNCYCSQAAGIAYPMNQTFGTGKFKLEGGSYKGDYNKLGTIDYEHIPIRDGKVLEPLHGEVIPSNTVTVINAYTQFKPGRDLDYSALRLCLRKIGRIFKGKHVGLPMIGCGIAGGDWEKVSEMIKTELRNCDVTIVIYDSGGSSSDSIR